MNPIGLVAAASAFLGIWIGHVAVRKIEANAPILWVPALTFVCAGGALEACAAAMNNPAVSAAAGIFGITFLWDALEIFRQEQRVQRGHAPANLANPRHQKMIDTPGSAATTVDLLKGEPG